MTITEHRMSQQFKDGARGMNQLWLLGDLLDDELGRELQQQVQDMESTLRRVQERLAVARDLDRHGDTAVPGEASETHAQAPPV